MKTLEQSPTQLPRLSYSDRIIIAPFILKILKDNIGIDFTSNYLIEMYEKETNQIIKGEKIRKVINHLRGTGSPIYSSSKGYRYTTSKQEIMDVIMSMKVRQQSMNYAINGMLTFFE